MTNANSKKGTVCTISLTEDETSFVAFIMGTYVGLLMKHRGKINRTYREARRVSRRVMKKIGTSARIQIERMMGTKVFLELYVKAEPGWRDSRRFVEELDWRRQLEHRMFDQGIPAARVGGSGPNDTKD